MAIFLTISDFKLKSDISEVTFRYMNYSPLWIIYKPFSRFKYEHFLNLAFHHLQYNMLINRSIDRVFNRDTGKDEDASSILENFTDKDDYVRLRRKIRIRNKEHNSLYLCEECGTELELSCIPDGKDDHTYFFKHIKDPVFVQCSKKTDSHLSKEEILKRKFAFKSESNEHLRLKQKVGEIVKQFIDCDVIIDKQFIHDRFGDTERRKPDIFFRLDGKEVTIEFQVNNTFHTVIQEREAFYERNGISLIWVFGEFDPKTFQSITIKDIFIPNGNNAFVFDNEAEQASYDNKTLCLKVFYKKCRISNDVIDYEWINEIVIIRQLQYNPNTLRPYYFDCEKNKREFENQLETLRISKKREKEQSEAIAKAQKMKQFLSRFKQNELEYRINYPFELDILSDLEVEVLNNEVNLNRTFENGDNVLQTFLKKDKHQNLIEFLLKYHTLKIAIESINNNNETSLISILKSPFYSSIYYSKLLFAAGYKLNSLDLKYISSTYDQKENKSLIYLYTSYQKLNALSLIDYFTFNMNEFLVIESAKRGELTILGNENQSLVWMANLAIDSYRNHWYYFDKAFTYYGFYANIFNSDKKHTFRKKMELLTEMDRNSKDSKFEEVLMILYPEINLIENIENPQQ